MTGKPPSMEPFKDGQRVYINDDGNVAVLHEAWVCRACDVIWPFTLAPTDGAECDACEQTAGWEWVE